MDIDKIIRRVADMYLASGVESLSEKELFSLSRTTGSHNVDAFEKALEQILRKLVPNMSSEAWNRISRNIYEHQDNCASEVSRSYFVTKGVQNFLEPLVQMAKRLS